MAYLIPDKVTTFGMDGKIYEIKQKIIPDNAVATKYVASYVQKGQRMKPCVKLNNGSGVPLGITIHNTDEIQTAADTNPAEQYTRATWPNQNMGGVVVHFYVFEDQIWQNLSVTEQGWHASDGSTRTKGHRGTLIGGNSDTIAIECIGKREKTIATVQALTASLCQEFGLDPAYDVYTHNYFMRGTDTLVPNASKNCPMYLLPIWPSFVQGIVDLTGTATHVPTAPDEPTDTGDEKDHSGIYRVQVGAFASKSNAEAYMAMLQADGYPAFIRFDEDNEIAIDPDADTTPTIAFQPGDRVMVKHGAKSYTGGTLATWVYMTTFIVQEVTGAANDRIVIGLALSGNATAAINASDLLQV